MNEDDGIVASPNNTFNSQPAVGEVDLDLEWRKGLSPVLQPIALRYGRLLFCYCYNVGMSNEALGMLGQGAQRAVMTLQGANARKTAAEVGLNLGNAGKAIHNVLAWFSSELVAAAKWTPKQLQECSKDIQRALQLAASSPNAAAGSKIILAN